MANQGKRMVSEDQIKKLENLADIREAGENITITNGVISAQGGAGYTAGTGIEITESNVINNTAPAVQRYRHEICYYRDISSDKKKLYAVVENTTSEPFTRTSFIDWLYDSGHNDLNKGYPCYVVIDNSTFSFASGEMYISSDPQGAGTYFELISGFYYKKSDQTLSIGGPIFEIVSTTFTDTVSEI